MATAAKKAAPRVRVAEIDNKTGDLKLGRGEVLATVPKEYILTLDDGTEKTYPAGIYPMLKAHATHWWSVQHAGVTYRE